MLIYGGNYTSVKPFVVKMSDLSTSPAIATTAALPPPEEEDILSLAMSSCINGG